eukprot:6214548-Pleurochrysis_carterae.AAC.1
MRVYEVLGKAFKVCHGRKALNKACLEHVPPGQAQARLPDRTRPLPTWYAHQDRGVNVVHEGDLLKEQTAR